MGKYEPKDWKSIESGKKPLSGNVTDRVVEDYMAHHGKIKSPKISGRVFTSPRKRMGGSVPKKRGGSKPTLDDMQRDHADAVRNYGKTGAKVPKARKATAIREATTNAAEDYVNSLDLSKAEDDYHSLMDEASKERKGSRYDKKTRMWYNPTGMPSRSHCGATSSVLARRGLGKRVEGQYHNTWDKKGVDHSWIENDKGHIIDASRDQFHGDNEKGIKTIKQTHPDYKHYKKNPSCPNCGSTSPKQHFTNMHSKCTGKDCGKVTDDGAKYFKDHHKREPKNQDELDEFRKRYTKEAERIHGLSKAEEKEQAMDQEEDLEELTDGELEEIEKRFEGIKRKLRNVKTRLNDVYEKDHPLETPKLTEGGAKVLAEAESKVDDKKRLESREQQSMYKSNKVPKKVRPESPNKDNNYQTQLDKPIQWKALKDKVQVNKTWETWLDKTLNQQNRRMQEPRHSKDSEDVDNTQTGVTELPKQYKGLAYGMTKPDSSKDTNLRTRLKLPFDNRSGKVLGTENKLTRDQAKIQSDSLVHQMFHDPEGFKKRVGISTGEKPEPDVHKKPQSKEPPREEPEWAKRSRAGGGKPQLRGKAENSFEKKIRELHRISMDNNEDYGKGTKPNLWFGDPISDQKENKGKQGKINEMLKSWEIWLERKKDQGQGDARYANPHETGMEDPRKLQVTRDDFDMEDEKDEDNKPYKERDHKSE